jgi:uncharacterized protein YeaO (DUF488 family)
MTMLNLKRVYDSPSVSDGQRILVDRLWPRGLTKRRAAVDAWMKDIAPSVELRRWFRHDAAKWPEFKRRYRRELQAHRSLVQSIAALAARRRVTLVYAAHDETHNDAVVLAGVVRTRMKHLPVRRRIRAKRSKTGASGRRPSTKRRRSRGR